MQKYKNKARNIALQNLICVYTDNKQLLDKVDIEKIEEEAKSGAKLNYKKKVEELDKRISILKKEELDMMSSMVKYNQDIKTQEETLEIFVNQEKTLKAKLVCLEKEYNLAKEFKEKSEAKIEELNDGKTKLEQQMAFIAETIDSLNGEKTKALIFMNHCDDS